MLRGLPASVILHAAVIGAGYIVLPALSRDFETSVMSVPIELVDISQATNIAPRIEREAPEVEEEETPPNLEDYLDDLDTVPVPEPEDDAPEEEPLAEEETAPPPPEEDEAVPLPTEEEPEVEPEPETPEPEPDRPVLAPERDDSLDDILGDASNLFDRTPREAASPPPPPPPAETLNDETPPASTARRGQGEMSGNTASVIALIKSQMEICWDDVVDLPNPERLNVTVRFELNRDGTLRGDVELVSPARRPIGDRTMGVAIDRALRAAQRCAPYRLPDAAGEFYQDWDEVTLQIGPAYRD